MFFNTIVAVAFGAFALLGPVANGHLIMNSPKPYNYYTTPYVEINPLDGVDYRYPCQGRGYIVDSDLPTVVAGGAPLPVNFTGTATHGGGSCQFSISYSDPGAVGGWKPDFQFKTIYSLIGGCPASSAGNLANAGADPWGRADGPHCGNDSGHECIRQFLVPFPKFLKNGRAIFSWTWHNRLGNREIYMNCAPIMITGGTEDWSEINALPDVFLGNVPAIQTDIPGHTFCQTAQNQTVNYPNPGNFGRVLELPTDPQDYVPSGYCSDIHAATMLPNFQSDPRTESVSYVATVTTTEPLTTSSTIGSVFVTIPTDPAGDGTDTTTGVPGVAITTSYSTTVVVTKTDNDEAGKTSWASTVTVTLPISTTVTVCSSKSGLASYGGGGESSAATSGAMVTSESTAVSEPLPDFTDTPVLFTETYNPVDTAPVMSTWIQPCGSTRPTHGDLTACWH